MKIRCLLCLLLCAALCVGLLTGCAPAPAQTPAHVVTAGLTGRTNALVSKLEPATAEKYDGFNFRTVLDDTVWYSADTANGREVWRIADVDFTLVQTDLEGNVLAEVPTGLTRMIEPASEEEAYGINILNGIYEDTDGSLYLYVERVIYGNAEDGGLCKLKTERLLFPFAAETGFSEPVELTPPEELPDLEGLTTVGAGIVLNGQLWMIRHAFTENDSGSNLPTAAYSLLAFSLKTGRCEQIVTLPQTTIHDMLYYFWPFDTLPLADGRLLLTGCWQDAVAGQGSSLDACMFTVDLSGKEPVFSEAILPPEGLQEGAQPQLVRGMQNTVSDGVYLYEATGVYRWNEADNTAEPIYVWAALSLNADTLRDIHLLSGDRMLMRNVSPQLKTTLRILTPADPDILEARPTLTLGVLGTLSRELSTLVEDFNAANPDSLVKVRAYTDEDAQAAGLSFAEDLLERDILQHAAPDVLLLPGNINAGSLVQKGVFLDLYPLLDADAELSRGDFTPNILAAGETNGTLPFIIPYYLLLTLAGDPDLVGKDMGMTWQQYDSLLAANPQATAPIYGAGRSELLLYLLQMGGRRFIDFPAAQAHLDTPEFAVLLEASAGFPEDGGDYNADPKPTLAAGKALFKNCFFYPDVLRTLVYEFDGPVALKGYPSDSGGCGSAILPSQRLAITADCADPALAWTFARTLLLPETQRALPAQYIPLRQDVLEERLAALAVPQREPVYPFYILEQILASGGEAPASQKEYFSRALTAEELDQIRALIDAVDTVYQYDDTVAAILAEEASAFYAGVRSAEEAAQLIQNRVQTYLDEQS